MKVQTWCRFFFCFSFFLLTFLTLHHSVQAQCDPGVTACAVDDDCRITSGGDCPDCFSCVANVCVPNDTICDSAAGACRQGICQDPSEPVVSPIDPLGCGFDIPALAGTADLEPICYICAPPEVTGVDTCGNGICEAGQGEDCQSCAADCQIPGLTCPLSEEEMNQQCNGLNQVCTNGDVCQQGVCITVTSCDIESIGPIACSGDNGDLCCGAACQGPPSGLTCMEAEAEGLVPAGACDVDCCPGATCGDNLVENPETCDGTAGIGANGEAVLADECRDPGAPAECTFCGDGITQAAAGEECDGADNGACGQGSCSASCTCEDICVTGSGNPIDTIRDNCGGCSLDTFATSQGWWKDYGLFLALISALLGSWALRRPFHKN